MAMILIQGQGALLREAVTSTTESMKKLAACQVELIFIIITITITITIITIIIIIILPTKLFR